MLAWEVEDYETMVDSAGEIGRLARLLADSESNRDEVGA